MFYIFSWSLGATTGLQRVAVIKHVTVWRSSSVSTGTRLLSFSSTQLVGRFWWSTLRPHLTDHHHLHCLTVNCWQSSDDQMANNLFDWPSSFLARLAQLTLCTVWHAWRNRWHNLSTTSGTTLGTTFGTTSGTT